MKEHIPESIIIRSINEGDYGIALDVIAQFVGSITSNPRSVGKVFSSPRLDKFCEEIGKKLQYLDLDLKLNPAARGTVILVTQIVASGGHIELIKDYIRLGIIEEPITVLATEYFANSEVDAIKNFLSSLPNKVFFVKSIQVDTSDKITFLQSYLNRHPPKELYLIASNHDSLAVSLASASKSRVIFIHHGDHHLCLGVHGENFIHVDPHNLGYFNCRNELGVSENRYWPLVVKCDLSTTVNKPLYAIEKISGFTTCSSGRYEKFLSNGYRYDYFQMIPKILAATKGEHIHIGDLPIDKLDAIRREILSIGLDPNKFIHIKNVPSLAASLVENRVDLYISSFPIGGGKASLEAMSVGVPLLMHDNYRSIFFSGINLVYPEAFVWIDESSLISSLEKILTENLEAHSINEKLFFEKYYSEKTFMDLVQLDGQTNLHSKIPQVTKNGQNSLLNFLEDDRIYNDFHLQKLELDELKLELGEIKNTNNSLNVELIELRTAIHDLNRFKQNIVNSRVWHLIILFNRLKTKLRLPIQ